MSESAPAKEVPAKMPNFESGRIVDSRNFYNEVDFEAMMSGHFGDRGGVSVLPAVAAMSLIFKNGTTISPYSFEFSQNGVIPLVPYDVSLTLSSEGNSLYLGTNPSNFAKIQIFKMEGISDGIQKLRLSDSEIQQLDSNTQPMVGNLELLPLHSGDWLLASDNWSKLNARLVLDERKAIGSFAVDTSTISLLKHLDNGKFIEFPILLECVCQQIATFTGGQGESPVFTNIKVINPSGRLNFPFKEHIGCQFKLERDGKKVMLKVVVSGEDAEFGFEAEAIVYKTEVLKKALERQISKITSDKLDKTQ